MIRRAWRAFTRGLITEANGWSTGAAIIAGVQAPAPGNTRVPATHPVPGQQNPRPAHGQPHPVRPAPAPAPPVPAHTAGPVSFMVYGWECGCELDFDGAGRVIWATSCGRGPGGKQDDFEDFLRGLTDASD